MKGNKQRGLLDLLTVIVGAGLSTAWDFYNRSLQTGYYLLLAFCWVMRVLVSLANWVIIIYGIWLLLLYAVRR